MIMMQYRVRLPAGYDMGIIRHRVATTGHLMDDYPGLGVKAYLVRERGVDGSTVDEYAPFYLWADAAGAASFLWSGVGFTNIIRDFGRPAVRTWIGGTSRTSGADLGSARLAVRSSVDLGDDDDVVAAAAAADHRCAAAVEEPGTLLAAYGIDPGTWQLVTFTLHPGHPADLPAGAVTFQVLHLSAPGHDRLPRRVDTRMTLPR